MFFISKKKSRNFSEQLCRCKISPGIQKSYLKNRAKSLKMRNYFLKKNITFFCIIWHIWYPNLVNPLSSKETLSKSQLGHRRYQNFRWKINEIHPNFFLRNNMNQLSGMRTFRTSRTVRLPNGSIFRPKTTSYLVFFGNGFIWSNSSWRWLLHKVVIL